MIKNYIKTALRIFRKNKFFAFVNISGLAIGISAALVIYLIVQYEFSYDKFHRDGDRIYRVVTEFRKGEFNKNSGVPGPVAGVVDKEISGIEIASKFYQNYSIKVSIPDVSAKPITYKQQENTIYADDKYFRLFDYEWIAGSPLTALNQPGQVVLTESQAHVYFPEKNVSKLIGKEIIYDDTINTIISGIVKDPDKASDFRFKEFISYATAERDSLVGNSIPSEWGSVTSSFQLFVKLGKNIKSSNIESQLLEARKKHVSKEDADECKYLLQPITDIHTNTDFDAFDGRQVTRSTLYGLSAVALFLLLLGCINFINLTTAQSSQRAKEIGVRKTMGSSKLALILQFLGETFLLTFTATVFSLLITPLILKIFSDFIPPGVTIQSVMQVHVFVFLAGLLLVVSLLSGIYPAFLLTRFKPVEVLKNNTVGKGSTRALWLRRSLTVTQFVIAQFLLIATFVVAKQVRFSMNKELGYRKEAIVNIYTPFTFDKSKEKDKYVLLEKFRSIPGIEKITLAGTPPASGSTSTTVVHYNNGKNDIETEVEMKYASPDYFDIYKMHLLAGRYLQASDSEHVYVINNTYAKALGFANPADAIGKFVKKDNRLWEIGGVLEDFNTKSTRVPIKPLAYSITKRESQVRVFHIALQPKTSEGDEWKKTLAGITVAFKEVYPDEDMDLKFFDESIAGFYKKEQEISKLLSWASGLCIFISCLGLLGLVIYVTNTRVKEIGVRKVLGASVTQIVSLLSKDFIALVLVASLLAIPAAWLAMHKWLEDFAYRTSLNWWIFALSGIGMIIIAILILSIRTVKSAIDNPIKSLRTE